MKPSTLWTQQNWHPASSQHFVNDKQPQRGWLMSLWTKFVSFLTPPTSEPRVWCSQDDQGNCYWNAYDPLSNNSIRGVSEDNLRIWLEDRYNARYHHSRIGDRDLVVGSNAYPL